jgi:hypothetical protein
LKGDVGPEALLDKLEKQMDEVRRGLETQFVRIAQMQQQIDELRAVLRKTTS